MRRCNRLLTVGIDRIALKNSQDSSELHPSSALHDNKLIVATRVVY